MARRYEIKDADTGSTVMQGDSLREMLTAWSHEHRDRPERNLQLQKDGETVIIHHGTVVNQQRLTEEELRLIANENDTLLP
jgi:hypothetical protein